MERWGGAAGPQLTAMVLFLRPDGMGTVTAEEKQDFEAIRGRIVSLLENQITHFRYQDLSVDLQICLSFIHSYVPVNI